ncbi:MAG: EthD domain-containing protein [Steroidobacteraceae bacterium]|jgi:hypothetical protein|nr:EthD domain-containing protein [Steroidobacteraceae bacterium]
MSQAPSPGPWVDPEIVDPRPWACHEGIVKFIEFPVRLPAMSRRAFHLYWQRHHSPHVMNATGFAQFMRKYVTTHAFPEALSGLPPHYRQVAAFEGAAEVWIASLREVFSWLSHPLYAELIQPDEPRFIDAAGGVEVILAREQRLFRAETDLEETDLVKVHALYRRRPELTPPEFHERLASIGSVLVAESSLRRHLRQFVISHRLCDPYPEELPPPPVDAVAEFWFEGRAQARAFFGEPAFAEVYGRVEQALAAGGEVRAVESKAHVVHDEYSFQSTVVQPRSFGWS